MSYARDCVYGRKAALWRTMPIRVAGSVSLVVIHPDLHAIEQLRCLLEHAVDVPLHYVIYTETASALTVFAHCIVPDLILLDARHASSQFCLAVRLALRARGCEIDLVYEGSADARLATAVMGAHT